MRFDVDRIAALVKRDLEEQFGDQYVFDPVVGERRIHYGYDESEYYCRVWVGYSGCSERPDSAITNEITTRLHDEFWEMWEPQMDTPDTLPPIVLVRIVRAKEFEEMRYANRGP